MTVRSLRRGAIAASRVTVPASITDAFNRADSGVTLGNTDTGQSWTALIGTWGIISSNQAYAPSPGIACVEWGSANMVVSAKINVRDNGTGVLARIQDANNFYFAYHDLTWLQTVLYKVVGGAFTVIGGPHFASAAGDVMRLTTIGTTITVHRNGGQIISVTDSSLTTGTKAGLRADTSTARFDDFSVAAS